MMAQEAGTSSNGFSEEFLEIVRNLVAYYVLRQYLVMLAMIELNPRSLDDKVVGVNTMPYLIAHREKMREEVKARAKDALEKHDKVYEPPIWKGDWKYFAHGGGCRLTHLRTREPIEWDGPDPNMFNIGWFMNNLIWRLKNEPEDPYIKACNDWLENQQADTNVVKKAIFRLIEMGILSLGQSTNSCIMVKKEDMSLKQNTNVPQEVVAAALNAIMNYRERQKLAIAAMIELRPDFVIEVAEDPYLLPEAAQRLKQLYQHLQTPPKSGSKIQNGRWNEVWDYDIRYAHCTITNTLTQEPIRWSSTDPNTADYYGFTQHFLWDLGKEQRDRNIQTIYEWMEDYIQRTHNISIATHEHGPNYIGTAWYRLLNSLIEQNIIVLTLTEQAPLINLR